MADRKKEDKSYERGGVAFIGSIILGAGVGWLIRPEYIVPGLVIGLGFGFILMAFMKGR